MQTMTIAQAKNQLSSLIHAAEQGEEVILTRHGKPVVRLVATQPVPANKSEAELEAQALALLAEARARFRPGISLQDWKALRDEGRRF